MSERNEKTIIVSSKSKEEINTPEMVGHNTETFAKEALGSRRESFAPGQSFTKLIQGAPMLSI